MVTATDVRPATAIPRPASPTPTLLDRIQSVVEQRVAGLPAWVVLVQLFIGLGWLRAGVEKFIEPSWWTGQQLMAFLVSHAESTLPWYQPFVSLLVWPQAALVALVVAVSQLAVGYSLVWGRFVGGALAVGLFLNLHFMAAGAVNPSAFYLLSQGALALWMAERAFTWRMRRRVSAVAVVAATLAAASLPFITTLHPARVIDEPAVMFVMGGCLTVLACGLVLREAAESSAGDRSR